MNEPFNFDREDPNEYSLVELKTLKELGVDRLKGWKITDPRESVVPERLRLQSKMREAEEARLRGENVGANRESGTVTGDRSGEIGGSVPIPALMGQAVAS